MISPTTYVMLGAEKQAAVSAALAWPEEQFRFVSDQTVLDGWDLPNVQIVYGHPDSIQPCHPFQTYVPLCPRWIRAGSEPSNRFGTHNLSTIQNALAFEFPEYVLPVATASPRGKSWTVKGDQRHRPDAVITGADVPMEPIEDPYHCGVLFQRCVPRARTIMATGRSWEEGVQIALLAIHSEVCAREEALQAGETIQHAQIERHSLEMLHFLRHRGFFNLTWIVSNENVWLTSFRPVPRAVFATLRRASLDLLSPPANQLVRARGGCKFATNIHYSSYRALSA